MASSPSPDWILFVWNLTSTLSCPYLGILIFHTPAIVVCQALPVAFLVWALLRLCIRTALEQSQRFKAQRLKPWPHYLLEISWIIWSFELLIDEMILLFNLHYFCINIIFLLCFLIRLVFHELFEILLIYLLAFPPHLLCILVIFFFFLFVLMLETGPRDLLHTGQGI